MQTRITGAIILLIGLALAKWQIYNPIFARELHITSHTISGIALMFAILLPLIGFGYLIFGKRFDDLADLVVPDQKTISIKTVLVAIALAVPLIGTYILVSNKLESLGFR